MNELDLVSIVRRADARYSMFGSQETVLVAVSGGPDSVALLGALQEYGPERGLTLHVAHLDHSLRPGSRDDAAFVVELCADLGLEVHADALDVPAFAAETGRSPEEAARAARYVYLALVAARIEAESVALGHNADDQAETVLMNFLRGSGLDGLRGMLPVAPFPLSESEIREVVAELGRSAGRSGLPSLFSVAWKGAPPEWPPRLVRPLLEVPREQIADYVQATGRQTRTDETNVDPSYLRNRLRHEILPLLEQVNPQLRDALARNSLVIARDVDFLESHASEAWSRTVDTQNCQDWFSRRRWEELPPAIQQRLLRRAAIRLGLRREFGARHVEAVRRAVAERAMPSGLPGGVGLSYTDDEFALVRPGDEVPRVELDGIPVALAVPGTTKLPGGWQVEAQERERSSNDPELESGVWSAVFDAAAVTGTLEVRGRRPGDRIQPLGMSGRHKTLKDLYVDEHVPTDERNGWPVVISGGEILWVPGLRRSVSARVTGTTRRVVCLTVRPPSRLRGLRTGGRP